MLRSAWLLVLLLVASAALAQDATVYGKVVRPSGAPVDGANVTISYIRYGTKSEPRVVASAVTDSSGAFRFQRLDRAKTYVVLARKIGYVPATSGQLQVKRGEAREIVLTLSVQTLSQIEVQAKTPRYYRIDALEISKHPSISALDVVLRYRPRMLGDFYKGCPPDERRMSMVDSTPYLTDLWWLSRQQGKRDPTNPTRPTRHLIMRSYPFRVFVNGEWKGALSALDVLALIKPEDIAEMRYIDCWDNETGYANSLMIMLQPGKRF